MKHTWNAFRMILVCWALLGALAMSVQAAPGDQPNPTDKFKNLEFREIGPATMGGRIDDFAVVESNPNIVYVGTASGGVWKTTNNGTTWEPIFDKESVSPSGDIAIAPSPHDELCRLFGSPVPTHTTAGSDGAMAMSPMVETLSLSNIGSQVVPLFVVFHTPPEAVPTYTMLGLLSTTAKSSMRPPIVAGPSSRNSRFLNLSVGFGWSPGAAFALTPQAPIDAAQARIIRRVFHVCFISIPLFARPGMLPRLGRITHQVF